MVILIAGDGFVKPNCIKKYGVGLSAQIVEALQKRMGERFVFYTEFRSTCCDIISRRRMHHPPKKAVIKDNGNIRYTTRVEGISQISIKKCAEFPKGFSRMYHRNGMASEKIVLRYVEHARDNIIHQELRRDYTLPDSPACRFQ